MGAEDRKFNEMGKKEYDRIEIPAELNKVVNRAIASRSKEEIRKMNAGNKISNIADRKNSMTARVIRYAACAAAGLLVCVTVGVNTNEAFAMEMQQLPVIGQLAKVLTVRSWHETEGDYEYNVEVPGITENDAQGLEGLQNPGFTTDVNAKIKQITDDYIAQAQLDMEEYKKAFFETGGTEKEWNDRTMDIYVDYNVKYQQNNILSLELITAKTWVASEEERHYYNLNLETGTDVTLEQLLGEDYIRIASESIIAQIEERIENDENQIFFGYGSDDDGMIEGFEELSPEAKFYINENGNAVIVFDEYEIAPGYMGFPEFEIK